MTTKAELNVFLTAMNITETWTKEEAAKIQAQSCHMFSLQHCYGRQKGESKQDHLDNCGYHALTTAVFVNEDDTHKSPNYAGWERLYVESRRAIKAEWLDCTKWSENLAYTKCLIKSINTFGITLI